MIPYFQPLGDGGNTLSVDNVVLDNKFSSPAEGEYFMSSILQNLTYRYHVELTHWEKFAIGNYRHQFTVKFADGTGFWIGVGLNLEKTYWGRTRLDFNPNKVAIHRCFRDILANLNIHSREMHTVIKRFDLAIDIPTPREGVFLVKDGRLYSERRHGQEYTQYLGKKSHTGHVKLYNKQAESKLDYPLTRLELTLDSDDKYEAVNWPTVYYISRTQTTLDEMTLTETDRFILNSILLGGGKLTDLGRKMREKMERLMQRYVKRVVVSPKSYMAILDQLRAYRLFPRIPLDQQDMISDANQYDQHDGFVLISKDMGVFHDGEEEESIDGICKPDTTGDGFDADADHDASGQDLGQGQDPGQSHQADHDVPSSALGIAVHDGPDHQV